MSQMCIAIKKERNTIILEFINMRVVSLGKRRKTSTSSRRNHTCAFALDAVFDNAGKAKMKRKSAK